MVVCGVVEAVVEVVSGGGGDVVCVVMIECLGRW